MDKEIPIGDLDKAEVLAALYNATRPLGMGYLHYDPTPMTKEEAEEILDHVDGYLYFDYLKGRVMKVNLSGDTFSPWLYDRDNGTGAAEKALSTLRKEQPRVG